MVKNSELTYGQHISKAREIEDKQEVGETNSALMERFKAILEDAVQKNYDKGVRGKYYLHIWVRKDPYANNTLHIFPQCRRTRPSPYQMNDHYLWCIRDNGEVTFEWCIPSKEILGYILANPNEFDQRYVDMLRKFIHDKLEKIEDYMCDGKIV